MIKMDNNIIVYHSAKKGVDCPDGICAAWIAAKKLGYENVALFGDVYLNNKDYKDFVIPFDYVDKNVIIVDFSYPAHVLEEIATKCKSLKVLDHHKGRKDNFASLDKFSDRVLGIYSPNEIDCGATIAWKHFFPEEEQPWFLPHVFYRDTGATGYYDGDNPESEAINAYIGNLRIGKKGKEAFEVFDLLLEDDKDKAIKDGRLMLVERNTLCDSEIRYWHKFKKTISIDGYVVPFVKIINFDCNKYYSWVSVVLHKSLDDRPPFVVIQASNENEVYHLRKHSSSRFDCEILATSLGGGGHESAAGFTFGIKDL